MSKEAYYFSHDANARQDEKILMLRAEHGWEGYGIYWALIEMMFESSETFLNHSKIKGIAVSYNIDITLLQQVINTCITEELFTSDNDRFWSESLSRRKLKFLESREKKSEAGKKGMAKRYGKQQNPNSVITPPNKGKESKAKEMKGNKEDTEHIPPVFDSSDSQDILNSINKYNVECKGVYQLEEIMSYIGMVELEVIHHCIKMSENKNVSYCVTIIQRFIREGKKTLDQVLVKPIPISKGATPDMFAELYNRKKEEEQHAAVGGG